LGIGGENFGFSPVIGEILVLGAIGRLYTTGWFIGMDFYPVLGIE
jgi:hypothetical protein